MEKLIHGILVGEGLVVHNGYYICQDGFGASGLPANKADDEVFVVKWRLVEYEEVKMGGVFVPFDIDGCYAWREPSNYLLKIVDNLHYYLTGNEDTPLGIDRGKYNKVWIPRI